MTNEEIIAKINKILTKVHDVFNQANTNAIKEFNETAPDNYKQAYTVFAIGGYIDTKKILATNK